MIAHPKQAPVRRRWPIAQVLFAVAALVLTGCSSVAPTRKSARPAMPAAAAPKPVKPAPSLASMPPTRPAPKGTTGNVAPSAAPMPLFKRIRTGKLANGLRYYILRHPVPKKRVRLWLAVDAGSALEDDDQRGLAHFLEHMAFNGTRKYPKNALVDQLERMGVGFGAHLNAQTGFDDTTYRLTVPSDDPKLLDTGVQILAEWAAGMTLDPAEIDKERGVVLEEWRKRLGARQRRFDRVYPLLFAGSRYADRLPIGDPETLKKAPPAAIKRFYRDWYRPDLMAVVAVGDISTTDMRKRIEAAFGGLRAQGTKRARPPVNVPKFAGLRVLRYADPESGTTRVTIHSHAAKGPFKTVADHRRKLVELMQELMLQQRLSELARRKGAAFLSAGIGVTRGLRAADIHTMTAAVRPSGVSDGLAALIGAVQQARQHGFAATELQRAKLAVMKFYQQYAAQRSTVDSQSLVRELLRYHFLAEAMPGARAELELTRRVLPGIELADVAQLPAAWTSGANRLIVVSGPDDKQLPAAPVLMARAAEATAATQAVWVDKQTPSRLMDKPPEPGRIVSERVHEGLGTTTWKLGNGATVIVKTTDFRKNDLRLAAFSPGGTSLASDADWNAARYALYIVPNSGVGRHDRLTLQRVLTGKRVSVGMQLSELSEGVVGRASTIDLQTFFQLLHMRFVAPRVDDAEFERNVELIKQHVAARRRSPDARFADDFRTWRYNNHRRATPTNADDFAAVSPARSLAFYKQRFGSASDFTFVFAGAVDPATLKPLVARYLATLPGKSGSKRGPSAPEKWRDVGKRARTNGEFTMRRGVADKARVELRWITPTRWSADAVDDALMLKEALNIVLKEELREALGGVYGVQVSVWQQRWPRSRCEAVIAFNCAPANVDKLQAAVWRVLDKLKKDGGGTGLADKIRAMRARNYEQIKRTNRYWLTAIKWHVRNGLDPARILQTETLVKRVSAKIIARTAKRALGRKQVVVGKLLPAAAASNTSSTSYTAKRSLASPTGP